MTNIKSKSSNRELVRSEAAAHGWKLESFANIDSFARKGTIAKIMWTDRDTAIVATLHPDHVAYAGEARDAEPRMAIVRMREWLAR